jgi:hypothetical protein
MFRTALWVIWILCALFFFLMALWSKLEQWSHKTTKHGRQAVEFLRQGIFVSFCVVITMVIDYYLLEDLLLPLLPDFMPIDFPRIMLFPVVLYIGALVTGGSKAEHITKAPKVSQNRSKKKTTSRKSKRR